MTRKQQTDAFQCRQCGACCRWPGHVLLTDGDIARLAAFCGCPEDRFIERCTRLAVNRRQLRLSERPDGSCIFLKENRCTCYDARPGQCRDFPRGWRDTKGCPALEEPDKVQLKR
jgi:Fe-S-cluster containining protein